ncbi:MAG: tRNA(5-methylaminomethyl-2-thiouridylate) methyltransferase [Solidesulfovibrio sp.]|uniref:tRNA(5-methylaminomethyl-2-thiouridylate) methyltransferase n=1 Tax=Solidesulfovibrio sp. TaxID=2910990 RepID=UPI002B210C83|nr:tRNA(5-methylaminomethyl-2-thiouridylate) methyltransferase [Solidesulfovibrio sp.]MEA4855686.1 tRNA(5-methylaminomethyl-2-thiouridylate) methyltransferase [Solidesulfovibrio sp.]
MQSYHALALFSGGLDSILAAKTVMDQGLDVLCLHFISPFFGKPGQIERWRGMYGLDIVPVDVSEAYVAMMADGPAHGLGKILNPCVDCKILMLRRAKELLATYGASFILSGEVVGQRPMSQRLDALNIIIRDSGTKGILLRPLCAKRLPETEPELSGLVDRQRLHAISGRGRKDQMALAAHYALAEIPTPAGGCLLTEEPSAKRFFPLFLHKPAPTPADFELANIGRQYWSGDRWLAIGRNQSDNARLERAAAPGDLVFKVRYLPGPLGVARPLPGAVWDAAAVADTAAFAASFNPKAMATAGPVQVDVAGFPGSPVLVTPNRQTPLAFAEPTWDAAKEGKRQRFTLHGVGGR